MDLKAAFDKLDREILFGLMEEMGLEEKTVGRIRRIYEERKVTIKTTEGYTEEFRTNKGVRQGCGMSPLLFNLYMSKTDS